MTSAKDDKPASARARLLDAASHLFYEDGVHTVGVDRVVERAGVAKATLTRCSTTRRGSCAPISWPATKVFGGE